ncbi:MAG: UvrD-helicase domain-containing protein [Acidobacteria bacterium]|nr:UvrD-helicase domain-containing protein [Acidobacteriota bacterium]
MNPAAAPSRDLSQSCVVEASAGTGKTTLLVARIVDVLAAGAEVESIAAVTFTNAAAGEMKLRVRQELELALRGEAALHAETKRNLQSALERLERAFIGTIHAFCKQMLRRRPAEAAIDPAFEEMAQPEALRLFGAVFRPWVQRRIAAGSPVLRRCFARTAEWDGGAAPLRALQNAAWKLIEWRDFPASWQARPFDRDAGLERILELARVLVALRDRCARPDRDPLFRDLQPVADFLERVGRALAVDAADYDQWESELVRLPRLRSLRWIREGVGPFADGVARAEILAVWHKLREHIEQFDNDSGAQLVVALRDELWELAALYEDAKRRAGRLDFMDLLIKTRDLLRDREALEYFRRRYECLFVDEFQDTDPLQAEILLLLASEQEPGGDWFGLTPRPGKLFVVGDPKQSIYRFRRADVALYSMLRARFESSGMSRDYLSASNRSTEPIQSFVNAAFEDKLVPYLPLSGGRPAIANQPSVIALPVPEPYGSRRLAKSAIDRCSPNATAAFIQWLVKDSKWRLSDRNGAARQIKESDICILLRRFSSSGGVDVAQEYARALEARGIQHVLVGSRSFHQREEVGAIRAALRAIEWPEDELRLFAAVRTFFAVPDATLLKFRHRHRSLFPFRELPEDLDFEFAAVRDALALFAGLHRERNRQPIATTILRLLEYTRAHAAFAFRKGGERVLANVYRLLDLAREFDAGAATSFRSFVEYLEEEADFGETGEAPVFEQSAAGVKLMTVHRAKGLEFPVVILADLTANLTGAGRSDRYVDAARGLCAQRLLGWAPPELLDRQTEEARMDQDEAVRLAYVAATRARDLLVVCAVGEPEFLANGQGEASWLSPLWDALYPPEHRARIAASAPGCPPFGTRTVLNRPLEAGNEEVSVKPGLHLPRRGGHGVVWFDPAVLDLTEPKGWGLENEAVLSGTPEQSAAGLARYRAWESRRQALIDSARAPRFEIVRAADAARGTAESVPIELISLGLAGARPVGRRFGKLVHALLASAAPGTGGGELQSIATLHARACGSPEEEIAAAIAVVRRAFAHPVLAGAAAARRCHRELPVVVKLAGGRLAEGRVDLAFSDGARWTVVDFKTGPADASRNREQLRLYAMALERASGQPVHAVLLEV